MPARTLVLVCGLLAFAVPAAFAQDAPEPPGESAFAGMTVADVAIKGNQNTGRAFVISLMKTKVGRAFDPDVLNEDVKRLYESGYFNDVETRAQIVDGGLRVTVVVVENLIVSRVVFEGRRRISRDMLVAVINTTESSFLDPADLKRDATSLERLYRSKGYYHVSVTTERQRVADGVDVIFTISEGPRVTIRNIEMRGNETLETKKLMRLVKTKESLWIISVAYYDEDKLQTDIVNLRRHYRDEGFLDAQVDLEEVELTEDKKQIDVIIRIVEGDRYTVRAVALEGVQLFDVEKVRAKLRMQPGVTFRTEDLIKDRELITGAYGDAGYIFANVGISTLYAGATSEIDVTYTVDENTNVIIGRVIIRGNVETKDKVIRRDLEFYPNERASLRRIERSMNRLEARDYYETVEHTFLETEDPAVRDVVVSVLEKPTGKARFGVGVTSNQGVVGEISITKANFDILDFPKDLADIFSGNAFTGAGQFFLIELQPGTDVNRFRVSFQEPYLFDKSISLTTGASFFRRSREDYDEQRLSADIALGKRLTRDIGVELGYGWQNIDIQNVSPAAPREIRDVAGNNYVSSVRLSLGIDKRDNPNYATTGYRGGLTQELYGGPLGGDYDFYRVGANWESHFTLLRDTQDRPFILSASAKVGSIIPYGDTDVAPTFERYYAGGPGTVRGFEYRGIGPRDGNDPVGGESQLLASLEFSVPVYDDYVRVAAFVDAGSVTAEFNQLPDQMRVSVGGAIQIFLPFLGPRPLELSLAWPLRTEPGDEINRVGFKFGN